MLNIFVEKDKKNYSNRNEKNTTDYKKFCKTVTLFLSEKVLSIDRITLKENDEIVNYDRKAANIMNTCFYNMAINLNILEYHEL